MHKLVFGIELAMLSILGPYVKNLQDLKFAQLVIGELVKIIDDL